MRPFIRYGQSLPERPERRVVDALMTVVVAYRDDWRARTSSEAIEVGVDDHV
jgi:hypothetical protein